MMPRALSAGMGKKNLQPRALTWLVLLSMRRWRAGQQGLRAGSAVRHVEHSTFDFRSGIIRAEIMGMTGHAPQSRPSADSHSPRRSAPYTHTIAVCCHCPEPEVTGPGPFQHFFSPSIQSCCGLAPVRYVTVSRLCWLHGDSGPPEREDDWRIWPDGRMIVLLVEGCCWRPSLGPPSRAAFGEVLCRVKEYICRSNWHLTPPFSYLGTDLGRSCRLPQGLVARCHSLV